MAATAFGPVVEARRQGAQERSAGKTMPWIGRAKPGKKDRSPLKASQGKVEVRTGVLDVFVLTRCVRQNTTGAGTETSNCSVPAAKKWIGSCMHPEHAGHSAATG